MFNTCANDFPLLSDLWIEKEFEILSNLSISNKNQSVSFFNNFISFKIAAETCSLVERIQEKDIEDDFIKKFLLLPRENNISGLEELQIIYTNISNKKCSLNEFLNILRNYYFADYKAHLTYTFLVIHFQKISFLKHNLKNIKNENSLDAVFLEIKNAVLFPKFLSFNKDNLLHFIENEKGYLL